jgi:hypothetical protein
MRYSFNQKEVIRHSRQNVLSMRVNQLERKEDTVSKEEDMKGLKIAAIICAAMLLSVVGVFAQPANPPVYKAAHAPAIDGVLDDLWENVPWNRDFKVVGDSTKWEGWVDGASSFRILYDAQYLYMFITVNDDTLVNDTGASATYQDDGVEVWLDGDNSKGAAYDGVNDLGIKFVVDQMDSLNWFKPAAANGGPAGMDLSGVLQAAKRTALGLDLEVAIPIGILGINTAPGSLFGLEIDYNDDDDGGNRDTKIKYFSTQDESWHFPNTLGTVEIKAREVSETLDVMYANTVPVIDGAVDAMWADVPGVDANNMISGQLRNYKDAALSTKVTWDTTNIYFLFTVKDDTLRRQSPEPANGRADWHSDCIELALDGNNGKTAGFDGVDDRFFNIAYQDPTAVIDTAYQAGGAPTPTYYMGGFKQASALTADGFVLEMSFPLDSLGIQPLNHWKLGLDADYDDNESGTRDRKIKTYATIDGAYNQPVLWGTLELLGGPVADYTAPVVASIPPVLNTLTVPTIDGKLDSAWVNVPVVPIDNVVEGTPANWWDSWASYRMIWDKTNVYLLVTVHDDTVITTNADPTQNDGIVITMDGDNKKTAAYDAKNDDAIQFVFNQAPVNLTAYSKNADVTKWTYAWLKTPTGYNLEVAMTVKLGLKFVPAGGKLVGFDIQVNDNDTGVRDGMIKWASTTATSPTPPAEFGTVQCVAKKVSSVLDIPFTTYPIMIDGDMDYGWNDASTVASNYYLPQAASDKYGLRNPTDGRVVWKTMWNMDYLLFYVHIIDDTLKRSSVATAGGWESDGLEIWLDGDNSKKKTYDGINDTGFSFGFNPDSASGMFNAGHWNNGTIPPFDMTLIKQSSKIVADGLVLELALPIDQLGIEPGNGSAIGIEVDYNDDDGGKTRNTKIKTYSGIDDSWTNPSVMGTAQLVGSNVLSGIEAIAIAPRAFDLSQNYPNPFNPFTKINYSVPKAGPVKLAVYDILGREVAVLINEAKPAGIYTVNFDASKLTSGIYIYRIEMAGKVQSKKLMLLK